MERRIETFFYGLFMDADLLREKGLHPTDIRRASVNGWALRIGDRATLVPDPAGRVHGMLMALSHAEVDRLYSESSVSAYRPEAVTATVADGSAVAALCFNLPVVAGRPAANPTYAARLRDVAWRLGLPEDYVESIR